MALDELHARRLGTVLVMLADALERMELLLGKLASRSGPDGLSVPQIHQIRQTIGRLCRQMKVGAEHFGVRPQGPEPRQALAAELSALWVLLENALPKRLKGYGRALAPADKTDWEGLIGGLASDLERIRHIAFPHRPKDGKRQE